VSQASSTADQGPALLALYDRALPEVYGYLLRRCDGASVAEDLTAETFLAAVEAVRRDTAAPLSTRWLIGVARHKLADHWRRAARETARLRRVTDPVIAEDPWPERLDALAAQATLDSLGPAHRLVLTLRYVDDLPVQEVAGVIGRSLNATEALLVRAKTAFRDHYREEGHDV
jgi:RNA polymerase sigma-70 factor (ECF subfamily)